jgi:hypothetical protein
MDGAAEVPRARVLLARGGSEALLGTVHPSVPCSLQVVDDLMRLRLVAARFGWAIRITAVRADLQELFELVGLTDRLDH